MISDIGLSNKQIRGWDERKRHPSTAKKSFRLPESSVKYLIKWFYNHRSNPHPTEEEMGQIISNTGLSKQHIKEWLKER